MAATGKKGLTTLVFLLCSVITSYAGENCYDLSTFSYTYCPGECCSYDKSQCCSVRIDAGLVAGLTVGGIILVVIIAVSACICRRRYYSGVIVHSQTAQPSVVVAQSTTSNQSSMAGGYQSGYQAQPYGVYPQYPPGYQAAGYAQRPPNYGAATPGYKG